MDNFNLQIGLDGQAIANVTEENTALKFGSGVIKVFATPAMIGLMENAAINAVDTLLPEGYASVGTYIEVKHLAATPVGMIIIAKAELIEINGKKLKFRIEAFDEIEKIGEGTHFRYIIKLEDFLNAADSKLKNTGKKTI